MCVYCGSISKGEGGAPDQVPEDGADARVGDALEENVGDVLACARALHHLFAHVPGRFGLVV